MYRNSSKGRTEDLKESLVEKNRREEQERAIEEARAKNNAKRNDLENKYPELAKYRNK